MSDNFLYECRECMITTCGGHAPPERDCPVCESRDWLRRAHVD